MKTRLFILSGLLLVFSCQRSGKQENVSAFPLEDGEIVIDTKMVEFLFPPGKDNLTGGDGAISIQIDNTKSFWLWGDSFLGEVIDNQRAESSPFIMGNVWQLLDGESVQTITGGTTMNPESLLKTEKVDGYPAVLWPMHGFVKNDIVHVFMSTIVQTGTGTWDFYWHSTVYYRLNLSDLSVIDKQELLTVEQTDAHFGFGVIKHEDFYYIYGSNPQADFTAGLHVTRARLVNNKLQDWEYYDGNNWVTDAKESKSLQGIDIPVSEQFSVFKQDNKFILLTQDRFRPQIYTFIADAPEGSWSNKKHIYTIPEGEDSILFTYNAMAHPQYGPDENLLVSYCVNAKNIPDLYSDVSIYKPRFFWVSMNTILK
ncbi:DUF4185 domain-containing protein [Proteiniphilum sp. X52]|uniref:DUF4185 domain-containing protein n=1 Tax=Proteiniphilum sp. X52 TaxID=2382159 RepID=UPI000F0A59BF|nr:DUF4185 domain-containing protein [Proteiniphilum sp. X52]RNC66497.1 DUF4185 domain-containing protein [Proteiniphilum sp. X52]